MVCGGFITVLDARRPSRAKAYEKVLATPTDKGVLKRMGIPKWAGVLLVLFTFGLFIFTQFANYFQVYIYISNYLYISIYLCVRDYIYKHIHIYV